MNIISDSLGVSACESSPDRWPSLEYLPLAKPLLGGISPPEAQKITEHFNARLFDEARADIPPRRSYAILDAAANPALPEFLENSYLTHACFFTGAALKETGEATPWLVELKPDHRLTRMLISASDRPGGLWDQDPGIIIKSNSSLTRSGPIAGSLRGSKTLVDNGFTIDIGPPPLAHALCRSETVPRCSNS